MAKASRWSWVTSTAVVPHVFRMSRTSSESRSRRSTSRLENGSSSSTSSGLGDSARASATRCCWPPDSSCGIFLRLRRQADQPQHVRHPFPARVGRLAAQAEPHVVVYRQVREQGVVLEHHADAPRFRGQAPAGPADDLAIQPDLAFRNFLEAGDAAQQRGLAAAGRSEQARDPSRLHRKADAVDDGMLAVALHDAVGFELGDGFHHRWRGRSRPFMWG